MTDPWKGILAPDEEILWQGTSKGRVRFEWDSAFAPIFFVFFTGFSIFWMIMASMAGGIFWTFGLLFFFAGSYNLIGIHFWKAFVRRQQHYTLTNQRAFIGTAMFGRKKLQTFPIGASTEITLEESGTTGNVYFAKRKSQGRNGTIEKDVGFEQIEDARHVLSKMREVQNARLGGD